MSRFTFPVAAFLTYGALALNSAWAEDTAKQEKGWDGWTFNVTAENDMFGSDNDRHYTHGTRFSLASPEGEVPDWLVELANSSQLFDSNGKLRVSYAVGQNLYTPSDITLTDPTDYDRPYAGWLYGSFGLVSDLGEGKHIDTFELTLGVVGSAAQGEFAQKTVHDAIGSPEPMGWDHQLKNEPGIILSYERKWHSLLEFNTGLYGLEIDSSPFAGGSLGNVYTHAEFGNVFRFGHDLKSDRGGPPRIRPSVPGSDFYDSSDEFVWYFFAGGSARAVARNIFLDGNTFTDSYSVSKREPLVFDFQGGIAVRYKDARLAFTQILRTKEFEGQEMPDRFGAITLSYQF